MSSETTLNSSNEKDKWHLNDADRTQDLVLSQDLLIAESKSRSWQGARTNKGLRRMKGSKALQKFYYEVRFIEKGLARVGWSYAKAKLDLGMDASGWGYGGTAKKCNACELKDYGRQFGEKFDIVGCILDLSNGEMMFTINGKNMDIAYTLDTRSLDYNPIFPTICVKDAKCHIVLETTPEGKDFKPPVCQWVSEAPKNCVEEGPATCEKEQRANKPSETINESVRKSVQKTERRIENADSYKGHVAQLQALVGELFQLESEASISFVSSLHY